MRKFLMIGSLIILLIFALGLTTINAVSYYKEYPVVKIFVEGNVLASNDVPAFQIEGRTMVPLRLVGEALDAKVDWEEQTKSVHITKKIPPIVEAPKKELIVIDSSIKHISNDWTEVSGKIKNNHTQYVNVRVLINYYEPRGLLGHVHVNMEDIPPGKSRDFYQSFKGDLHSYTKRDIIIEELEWNP